MIDSPPHNSVEAGDFLGTDAPKDAISLAEIRYVCQLVRKPGLDRNEAVDCFVKLVQALARSDVENSVEDRGGMK
jgi:hypothetical protein